MIFWLILIVFAIFFYHLYWKRRNLPPGPMPLPFLGNMLTLARHEPGYSAFEMWRRKYGPIYTYWVGNYSFVVIADYPTIKETVIKDGETYQDKFNFEEITRIFRGGSFGIIDTNGQTWREHRRFALHQLREFGLGKNIMEQRVLTEVDALLSSMAEHSSSKKEMKIQEHIDRAVGSVINQLLFGYRFDEKTLPEFLELKGLLTRQMHDFSSPAAFLIICYAWLRYFPFFSGLYKKFMFYRNAFYNFFAKQIEEHEQHVDYSSQVSTDYVDAYLKEQRIREEDGDYESFSKAQLSNVCLDLWVAGMETTSNTLAWTFVYVLNHSEVQVEIHAELDSVVGSGREITMADKVNLPYLNAVINEVQRLANLLPLNLNHQLARPTNMLGYNLEKGQGMLAQISTVLYDEDVFPEPYAFRPERFIDENGKLKKVEELVPFSIGKRQCLGEGLARMELFLFTANVFNRFEIEAAGEKPKMDKKYGITMQPLPYNILVKNKHA